MPSGLTRRWIRFADKDMRQGKNAQGLIMAADNSSLPRD
jgi:hypothetical protein